MILMEAWIPCDCIFVDFEISGIVPSLIRAGFKKLSESLEKITLVKYLYGYELYRLGRTTYDIISIKSRT
jgi:hypothetical protein